MIERPPHEAEEAVGSAEEALRWIDARL